MNTLMTFHGGPLDGQCITMECAEIPRTLEVEYEGHLVDKSFCFPVRTAVYTLVTLTHGDDTDMKAFYGFDLLKKPHHKENTSEPSN